MDDTKQVKISIITPVYNTGNLLSELADNLAQQKYSNLEWILVDDGSSDSATIEILNEIDSLSFAQVFRVENGGAPAARNYGYIKSSGTFVKFLDADDLLAEDHLRIAAGVCDTETEDLMVISPQMIMQDFDGEKQLSPLMPLPQSFFEDPIRNSLRRFPFHHSACFIHRKLANRVTWDEDLAAFQDLDYLWHLFLLRPTFRIQRDTYFINREHNYTERITTSKSSRKWNSRVQAVNKLSASLRTLEGDYEQDIIYRYNTIAMLAFLEDRPMVREILQAKQEDTGKKVDLDFLYRLSKRLVKRILGLDKDGW